MAPVRPGILARPRTTSVSNAPDVGRSVDARISRFISQPVDYAEAPAVRD
jgi:hypothetical protein